MAWVEFNGVHINMELVRKFWWERIDTYTAHLCLEYGSGEVLVFDDPHQGRYYRALTAVGGRVK